MWWTILNSHSLVLLQKWRTKRVECCQLWRSCVFFLGIISMFNLSPIQVASHTHIDEEQIFCTLILFLLKNLKAESPWTPKKCMAGTSHSCQLPKKVRTSNHLVHSYWHVAASFAARLTAEEAKDLKEKNGVLSVQPENILPLHTSHSPKFLGLSQGWGLWKESNYGKGVWAGKWGCFLYENRDNSLSCSWKLGSSTRP